MAIGAISYFDNDELKIYRGEDFIVSNHIKIHQPTLDEICEYGEKDYYQMLYMLTATPQALKAQLWDMEPSIDYTKITPYELFYSTLYMMYSQEQTSIIFGDLDFRKFQLMKKEDGSVYLQQDTIIGDIYGDNDKFLYHFTGLLDAAKYVECEPIELVQILSKNDYYNNYIFKNITLDSIEFDEYTYSVIMDYICKSHFIERDLRMPANNSTKMILIEDAREENRRNKMKEYHSTLKNLVSAMVNSEGFKYNHSNVWDMKINAFMDSVKRIGKIKNSNLLLQSGYSGFGIDLKNVDKKQLDWLGELE